MANTIRIKRRAAGGASGAPSSLKTTEPAYNEQDGILYLGYGDDGSGNATSIRAVAGEGAVCMLTGNQTIAGVKTFSSVPATSVAPSSGNDLTNKTYVDAQVAAGVSDDSVTNTKLANMAQTTVKGRQSGGGTGDPEDLTAAQLVTIINTADGAGSLLDADLLDGQQGSYYAPLASPTFTGTPAAPTASASTNTTQIATTAFVQQEIARVNQGIYWKQAVRVASTATVTVSNPGTSTFDGVAISSGDRILLKNQSAPAENGIYVFNGSGSAMTRATDFDSNAEAEGGAAVWVEEGSTNADTGWVLTTDGTITIGTTALTFTQFSGLGQITAGTGLSKSGNTISVATDGVTNTLLANMAQATVKGRQAAGGTGDPEDLTAAQLVTIINTADGAASGLDSDLLDGQHGSYYLDLTNATGNLASARVSGSYTGITGVGTIAAGVWQGTAVAVSYGGTGAANATDARTNLGLGSIATQAASNVSITGGTIDNITINGGTF